MTAIVRRAAASIGQGCLLALGCRRGQAAAGSIKGGQYFIGGAGMCAGVWGGQVLPQPFQRRTQVRAEGTGDEQQIGLRRRGGRWPVPKP
ncbi:hypothetical protein ACIQ1J_21335 [Streptomyces sp. NPDC097107]|uniref:hypothetical protein n=1 Tax=Streptomyces sp. NPDC097107 TaxID=3366089 RepID=UPI00380BBCCF